MLVRLWLIFSALMALVVFEGGGCRRSPSNLPKNEASTQDAAPEGRADPMNLILITLDTTRADHLGCYGYFRDTSPTLDALAKDSIFFDHCVSPMAQTLPAHMSIMTGTYPDEHGILANVLNRGGRQFVPTKALQTIAQVLNKQGYDTAGFVSATPLKAESGISVGFNSYSEPSGDKNNPAARKRKAKDTNAAAFAWLAKRDHNPFFLWIHYFDPHTPYDPPAPYDTRYKVDESLKTYLARRRFGVNIEPIAGQPTPNVKEEKLEKISTAINLYDGELRYLDTQLKILFEQLKVARLWDRSILVVTGDHGEGLGQHGIMHHNDVWAEQVYVPLMIRMPGMPPRRVTQTVSSVDILATVMGLAGDRLKGQVLLKQSSGTNVFASSHVEHVVLSQRPFGLPQIYSLTSGAWRYFQRAKGKDWLYNIDRDPFELSNVLDTHADVGRAMKEQLDILVQQYQQNAVRYKSGQTVKMSQQRKEELNGLGYVDTQGENEDEEEDVPSIKQRKRKHSKDDAQPPDGKEKKRIRGTKKIHD